MINRRKIIYFLVAAVVGLLLINVLLGLTKKKNENQIENNLSVLTIEERFFNTLDGFGIENDWIAKQNLKKGTYDSISYKYIIKLPFDVAIPVVLKDLNESFNDLPVSLNSQEKKNHGYSILNIESNNYTMLVSEFNYHSELTRLYSEIGFLISGIEDATESELTTFFNLPFKVGVILPLSEESQQLAELVKTNNLTYYIQLLKESDNINYNLDGDLGLEKLIITIRNIISSFNSPRYFFINQLESGFTSTTKNFIYEQFGKKGRQILNLNSFINLKGEDANDLKSLLEFHINKLTFGSYKIFRIELNDWFLIEKDLITFMKKGNKIVNPSQLF